MGSEKTAAEATGAGLQWDHPARCYAEVLDKQAGTIHFPHKPMPPNIAIVGFASSSRSDAPFDDPEWMVIGLNQLNRHIPRADLWIEIHSKFWEHVVEGTKYDGPGGFLETSQIPIFMCEAHEKYPNSLRYPIEEMRKTFGNYFTSTIAYALAWAITQKPKKIGLWGVDLAVADEYTKQKPAAERLIGYAEGAGIEVILPENSALCKAPYLYGYENEPPWFPVSKNDLVNRQALLQKEVARLRGLLATTDGALQDTDFWISVCELRERGADVQLPWTQ
jgi:hypothetical protein